MILIRTTTSDDEVHGICIIIVRSSFIKIVSGVIIIVYVDSIIAHKLNPRDMVYDSIMNL